MITKIKFFIRHMLCNGITGSLLAGWYKQSIPDIRWKGYRFQLPAKGVSKTNIAAIFWGFYESAEIRLIQKYMDPASDVVELGASLGIVTGHIISKLNPGTKIISVEANPFLIDNINSNMKKFAKQGVICKALNNAVQYNIDEVAIHISDDNTESSIDRKNDSHKGVMVKATTLQHIVEQENLMNFSLVCDIEGSEIEMILCDAAALKRCSRLFIELHTASYHGKEYKPDDILDELVNIHGFKLMEQQGPVCYLKK